MKILSTSAMSVIHLIFLGGPGVPSIERVIVLMVPLLVLLWLLNTLYEWLKRKPWRKKDIEAPTDSLDNPLNHEI